MKRYESSYEYHPADAGYPSGKMEETYNGEYVLYDDHLKEMAEKEDEIAAVRETIGNLHDELREANIELLITKEDNAALKEELAVTVDILKQVQVERDGFMESSEDYREGMNKAKKELDALGLYAANIPGNKYEIFKENEALKARLHEVSLELLVQMEKTRELETEHINKPPQERLVCKGCSLPFEIAKYKAFWEDARMADKMTWEQYGWPKHQEELKEAI